MIKTNQNNLSQYSIRFRTNDPKDRTKRYNGWLMANGFVLEKTVSTYFQWPSL